MACSAGTIANNANCHCYDIAFAVAKRAGLFTEHLKIPPLLNWKLIAHFAHFDHSLFFMLSAFFLFCYGYWMTGPFIIYFMQVSLSLLLVLKVLLLFLSAMRLTTLVDSRFRTLWIPALPPFVAKLLSSFLCIGRDTLYLKVPGSLGLV